MAPVNLQVGTPASLPKKTSECRHHLKGGCRLGDTCLFRHSPKAMGLTKKGKKSKKENNGPVEKPIEEVKDEKTPPAPIKKSKKSSKKKKASN